MPDVRGLWEVASVATHHQRGSGLVLGTLRLGCARGSNQGKPLHLPVGNSLRRSRGLFHQSHRGSWLVAQSRESVLPPLFFFGSLSCMMRVGFQIDLFGHLEMRVFMQLSCK